jgi:molybdenum cofactor synthesis domain-containing protein
MPSKYQSSAKIISIEESVGQILAHDITEIRPGQFKGPAFKKGHVIQKEDLEHLRRLGKEHLFALRLEPGELHEDEAATRLAEALAGPGVLQGRNRPSEGKMELKSAHRGLLKVQVQALKDFNLVPDITCASRHNNDLVQEGEIIAATKATPLVIEESSVNEAVNIAIKAGGIFSVKPFSTPDTGLIITGNEVYYKRIEDKFAPLIRKKMQSFGCPPKEVVFSPDDSKAIAEGIRKFLEKGYELILVAGGMSVDPDDVTRMAIADAGARDIVYGTPVHPGAMFLYGRFENRPVLGLPACVLYYRTTVFDLLLPRVLAGERITREDLAELAHGGLCLNCEQCRYPICPFGK